MLFSTLLIYLLLHCPTSSAGLDYAAVTQVLEFNVSRHTVIVPITNDTLVESNETFFGVLTLISMDADGITVAPDRATINILDQDSESPHKFGCIS